MKVHEIICLLIFAVSISPVFAQIEIVRDNPQVCFPDAVPAGNFSGIASIGNNRYAVVDDKSAEDGFHVFHISIDSITGQIDDINYEGFRSSGEKNRDVEGVVFNGANIWITGESDNIAKEYCLDGTLTGKNILMPLSVQIEGNYGLESLTWHPEYGFAVATENPVCFFTAKGPGIFSSIGRYKLDEMAEKKKNRIHMHGVSEILWLDDGSMLVLEREVYIPKKFIGSWTLIKLYQVELGKEEIVKRLLLQWKTRLNITSRSFANYEGMCLGPVTTDGNRVLILVADSQNQYKGVLKDYFKTIVIKL